MDNNTKLIIPNMCFKEYRSKLDHVSISELKSFMDSPFSYYKRYVLGVREETKIAAFTFGTLVHTLLLEPAQMDSLYYVTDVRKDARTKAYQEVLELAGKRECISPADLDRALECSGSARPMLRDLGTLVPELSYFYQGPRGFLGQKVKARLDGWLPDSEMILDVKTTNKLPTYENVVRSVMSFNYDMQVAWYMDMHRAVTGKAAKGFVFLFVQSEFPYGSQMYTVDRALIEHGRARYKKFLAELAATKSAGPEGLWPRMRPERKTVIRLPDWVASKTIKLRRLTNGTTETSEL